MNKLVFLFAAALLATPAIAQETLSPDRSVLDEGDAWGRKDETVIVHVLQRLYGDDVMARAVVVEMGVPEFGVGVSKQVDGYEIVGAFSPAPISSYEEFRDGMMAKVDDQGRPVTVDFSNFPPDPHDLLPELCHASIPGDVGSRLIDIWTTMLSRSRVEFDRPSAPMRVEGFGRAYHYSVHSSLRFAGGRVDGWYRGSDTEKFVGLVGSMAAYCRAPTPGARDALTNAAAVLSDSLLPPPRR